MFKNRVRVAHQAECKCGWQGAHVYGKGSRSEAWTEWRWHQDNQCPTPIDHKTTPTGEE